jgi:hypothetical protein
LIRKSKLKVYLWGPSGPFFILDLSQFFSKIGLQHHRLHEIFIYLEQKMFTFTIESTFGDASISFKSESMEKLSNIMAKFNAAILDDEEDDTTEIGGVDFDELEFDEEGFAWWYDESSDEWYWYNEEDGYWEEAEYEDEESEDDAE